MLESGLELGIVSVSAEILVGASIHEMKHDYVITLSEWGCG